MKKTLYILFAGATLIFSSCINDYLEVTSQSTSSDDVVFSQPEETEAFIYGIYNVMALNNSYRNRLGPYHGLNSDTEYRDGMDKIDVIYSTANPREAIPLYAAVPGLGEGYNNDKDDNPWSYLYQAIEKCNLAITNIKKYGNPQGNATMGYLLGEAITLRAFFYNDLIKIWGDVPARFEPVTPATINIGKTYRGEIYRQLIADLGEAAALVPWNGDFPQTATTIRVNKAFVKGLRARICLAAAGKAMLPVGTSDSKIDYIFSDESVRRGLYDIARSECGDIIRSKKYALENDFTQPFKLMCQHNVSAAPGHELIFQLPYNPGVRGQMYYFFGLTWPKDDKYVGGALSSIGGTFRVVPSFFYDFNDKDKRKFATAAPYTMELSGGVIQPKLSNVTDLKINKWRADYFTSPMTSSDDGVGLLIMRYADILLMYAEADLYLGATDGETYLNEVRRRAFGSAAYDVALTLDNVKNERAFEFVGENIRKFDLIRWGELGTNLKALKGKMQNIKAQTGAYADVPQYVYYRLHLVTGKTDEKYMEIYGLNRGETDDKRGTDPANGEWTRASWTNGTGSGTISATTYDRINDMWLDNFIFRNDPDKRQLMPIMNVITSSNPNLKNDYGY